jgi:DNA-binding transcriptional ArsR family regulator
MVDEPRTTSRVPVVDLVGRRRALEVEVTPLLCAEAVVGLTKFGMGGFMETFDVGTEWFQRVRTTASEELMAALAEGGTRTWGNLLGLALQPPVADDVPALLERVRGISATDLWLIHAGYHHTPFREVVGAETLMKAAEGDPAARRALADAERTFDVDYEEPRILSLEPVRTKQLAVEILQRWNDEVLAPEMEMIRATLRRDATAKVAAAPRTTPEELIEQATGGLEFRPEPWIRRVVLVPHVAMRPWNVSSAWEDAQIICYPVADESLGVDPTLPPARLLRLYKALSDDKRMRILKMLARSNATLQELADAVGLAKSTAHHHMVILRSAGLVRVTTELHSTYSLRREAIRDPSSLLRDFLEGEWS